MIKKRGVKRSGSLIVDALIALVIVFMAISVVGSIIFAYSSITFSADVSRHFNEFCDYVDGAILGYVFDDPSDPDYPTSFLGSASPVGAVTIPSRYDSSYIEVSLVEISSDDLTMNSGRRRVPVKIYMIREPITY